MPLRITFALHTHIRVLKTHEVIRKGLPQSSQQELILNNQRGLPAASFNGKS